MVPDRTWGWYAALLLDIEERKGVKVRDVRQWSDAVAVDGIRRLSDQAEKWNQMFDVGPRELAAALVDGTAPRFAKRIR